MLCRDWCLVNTYGDTARAITMHCNSWQCPVCKERRAARLVMQARDGKPNTFITLTVNPGVEASPDHRAALLARSWRIIRKRAMRKYGYAKLPFIAVFEKTKRGEPHLHILARRKWLDQGWLSDQMAELMRAPIVDIRRVKSGKQIAKYVSKYIGKDPHRFGTTKRYWSTQDWSSWRADREAKDEDQGTGWQIVKMMAKDWATMMEGWGWEATLVREGYEIRRRKKEVGG